MTTKSSEANTNSYDATIAVIKEQRDFLLEKKKELDSKIQAAMSRHNGAIHNPITLQDYIEYLKLAINRRGERFAEQWSTRNTPPNYGSAKPHNQVEWRTIDTGRLNILGGSLEQSISGDELCFYFPEKIHERLAAALKARYGESWGNENFPPASARKEIAAEAERELSQLRPQLTDVESKISALNRAINN